MHHLFLSYRRVDSAPMADRIYLFLRQWFGLRSIFIDVDVLEMGKPFDEHIERWIRESAIVLVIIGPRWLDVQDDLGQRRLDRSDDWVRREIILAQRLKKRIIPVLVESATMPMPAALPHDIQGLALLHAATVRHGRDFESDMRGLLKSCVAELGWHAYWSVRRLRIVCTLLLVAALFVMGVVFSPALTLVRSFVPNPSLQSNQPSFPLHVVSPGTPCDHSWASAYWTNRFGTVNCLGDYTKVTSLKHCYASGCENIGTIEFPIAVSHLPYPRSYSISIKFDTFGLTDRSATGTPIVSFTAQDFVPSTPQGTEYAVSFYRLGDSSNPDTATYESYAGAYDCPLTGLVCTNQTGATLGTYPNGPHTFAFTTDGKTTTAVFDGHQYTFPHAIPLSSFKYVQLAIDSGNPDAQAQVNIWDFQVQKL